MLTQIQNIVVKDNLTLEEIERMLGDNGILENPRLLDMMDDNLSISIADLCLYYKMTKNTVFREQNIVEELSNSNFLYFNSKRGEIQRKVKGLRRILLFQDLDNNLSVKEVLKELDLLGSCENCDESNRDYVKAYYQTEEEAIKAIKIIESFKWEKNLNFRCQIKCESFKCNVSNQLFLKEPKKVEINNSLEKEIHIVLDKKNYTPRVLEPDNYSSNYSSKKRMPLYKRRSELSMNSNFNNDYISNSTKESSDDDLKSKKTQNRKTLVEVFEKMKLGNTLIIPLIMEKNFNSNIMEKTIELEEKVEKCGPQSSEKNPRYKYYKSKRNRRNHQGWLY